MKCEMRSVCCWEHLLPRASRVLINTVPLPDNEQPDQPQEQERQSQCRSQHRQPPPKPPNEQLEQYGQAPRLKPRKPRSQEQLQEPPQQPDRHPKQKIPRITIWKKAVKQWDEGDRENGLTVSRHKWTQPMIKGCLATCYSGRAIAKEFLFLGRDEDRVQKVYGHRKSRVHKLVGTVRWRHIMEKRQFGKQRVLAKAKGRQSQKRTAKGSD